MSVRVCEQPWSKLMKKSLIFTWNDVPACCKWAVGESCAFMALMTSPHGGGEGILSCYHIINDVNGRVPFAYIIGPF